MTHTRPSRTREHKSLAVELELVVPTGVRIDELSAIKNWRLMIDNTRRFDVLKPIIKRLKVKYKGREIVFTKEKSE